MTSLRRVTVRAVALLLTAIGLVGAFAAYVSARHEASEFLDLQQQQIARYVGDLSFVAPRTAELPPHDPEDDYVVEVVYPGGAPMRTSNPRVSIPDSPETGFSEFTDAFGTWRVFSLVTPERTVQVAQQTAVRRELAAEASFRAALPLLVAIPLSWLLLEILATRIFGRLVRVADGIAGRNAADTTPIPVEQVPSEVLPVVGAMNGLLERLRSEMLRQRSFLSDAAHELRTPLTALTLQIGNLRGATSDPAVAERLEDLQAGAQRAAALTNQLLRIARYDAADGPAAVELVRLDDLVTDVVAGLIPLADSRSVDLGIAGRSPVTVPGCAADFRALLEILVDNAVRYTQPGGRVDVGMVGSPGSPAVVVSDTGPGVLEDILPRLPERFFRGPDAAVEGTGLGLAIARSIADRHEVALSLANRVGEPGFVATLTFRGQVSGSRGRP